MRRGNTLALALVIPLVAAPALALPTVGARLAGVAVEDTDGKAAHLPSAGKTQLFIVEGRDEQEQNRAVKQRMSDLLAKRENAARLELVAIADLAQWDWWPARHYARKAVRDQRDDGVSVYCDWKGHTRAAWSLAAGKSGVVLVDGDGRVRFSAEGTLTAAQRSQLDSILSDLGIR